MFCSAVIALSHDIPFQKKDPDPCQIECVSQFDWSQLFSPMLSEQALVPDFRWAVMGSLCAETSRMCPHLFEYSFYYKGIKTDDEK